MEHAALVKSKQFEEDIAKSEATLRKASDELERAKHAALAHVVSFSKEVLAMSKHL